MESELALKGVVNKRKKPFNNGNSENEKFFLAMDSFLNKM